MVEKSQNGALVELTGAGFSRRDEILFVVSLVRP
jgi:hypothetical protein